MKQNRKDETHEEKLERGRRHRAAAKKREQAKRDAMTPEEIEARLEARRAYQREWQRKRRLADPEAARERDRIRYRMYDKKNAARAKAYREKNAEAVAARAKARYEAGKEKYLARSLKQRKARLRDRPWYNSLNQAKNRAKRQGLPYSLSDEWAASVWTGRCALTGVEFELLARSNVGKGESGPRRLSPSLDKIDPALGYTPENSRFVCFAVNTFKGETAGDDFIYQMAELLLANRPE